MRSAVLACLTAWGAGDSLSTGGETFTLASGAFELVACLEPLTDTATGLDTMCPDILVSRPFRERARYDVDQVRRLLPDAPVQVGAIWPVDPKALLPFLRQLLPGASDVLHHGEGATPGAFACLRWASADAAEIVLRAHAEFHFLAGEPHSDVWITPAQFRGRLRLDRRAGTVSAFELLVPDASSNVDVNVRRGETRLADIGRLPCMQLSTGPFPEPGDEALPLARVEALLARRFYPAAELEWLALPEALARARASGKPLHVVTLLGSLFDESC